MAVLRQTAGSVSGRYGDLISALNEHPRRIPSKYFYDDEGSRLFEQITEQDEYYPARAECEILKRQSQDVLVACGMPERLNVVELGAGDGRKTAHLLRACQNAKVEITYRPVDISRQALYDLESRMFTECPGVRIEPCELDLETRFRHIPMATGCMNLVLFLGSSLGNYLPPAQLNFLTRLRSVMHKHDHALIGFDLKKDARILERAYNDKAGVTRTFNMNLLKRLNRELHADFSPKRFKHQSCYNPATGAMESWLISQEEQTVHVRDLGLRFHLDAFEGIHVETSWKFSPREIRDLALHTGFARVAAFFDKKSYFTDELWSG